MKAGKHTAGSTGALLSLANWTNDKQDDAPHQAPPQPADATAARISPLLSGLAGTRQEEAGSKQAPVAGPTLFDLLKAKTPKPTGLRREPAATIAPQVRQLAQTPTMAQPRRATKAATLPAPSRARWLALPAGALAGAAASYLLAGAPIYDARAEMILKPEVVRGATGLQPSASERPQVTTAAVEHSMARLGSPEVLEAVVDRLSLTANPAFGAGDRAAAVARLAASLSASPQSLTAGYAITARAADAALAGDIANAAADSLVETHAPEEAGPPPTRLELAFRAMPGVAGPEQTPLIPAGLGGLAGAALGLGLAIAAGRRRMQGSAPALRPSVPPPSPPSPARRQPAPAPTPSPVFAQGIVPRRPAMPPAPSGQTVATQPAAVPPAIAEKAVQATPLPPPRPNHVAGLRQRLRRNPAASAPAGGPTPGVGATTGTGAAALASAPVTPPSRPAPEPAMYPTHPLSPLAYPPQQMQPHAGWWPQPPVFAPAYPQQMPISGYPQPMPYYPPAMPHFAAPAPFFPAPQPQVQHYPVAVPVPYPVPVAMAAPGPVIQHEAPRQSPAAPTPAAEASDHTAETLSAIDEVRAQLRAFAGSLDALRAARSA
ncbi:MAG: hypothetical protein KF849_13020 [Rhizobiaceae bacterium]|nr:hypothetical protein [Rhizobiaceae bacterium]